MSEPAAQVEIAEILKIMLSSVVAAIGSVLAWWRHTKNRLYGRIDGVEASAELMLKELTAVAHTHTRQIAVLETNQSNNVARLERLQQEARDANLKLDSMQDTLIEVLVALKSSKH